MAAEYLNTDLVSTHDLMPLVKALEQRGMAALHAERLSADHWLACLEFTNRREPAENIGELLQAIESLPLTMHAKWKACSKRAFNIGYTGLRTGKALVHGLAPDLLQRMAKLGITLEWTLYPALNTRQASDVRRTTHKPKPRRQSK